MEIKSLESGTALLRSGYKTLEKEHFRQLEVAYEIGFKMTQIETRVAKMKGASSDVNPQTEYKVSRLERAYEEKRERCRLVKAQVLKVEDDMRQLTIAFGTASTELERLEDILKQRQLECEGGAKMLEQNTLANQERLVDESIMRMRVHQMGESVRRQHDKVFSLEKHRADLEEAMNERLLEIRMQGDLLRLRRKHLTEQLAQLRADIGERGQKITALIARYGNAIDMLGKNDDGSLVSATQIRIETAQEKQLLLRDGNELNEKVIGAERDIKAIENTLLLLNYSNETYKRTLEPVNEDSKLKENIILITIRVLTSILLPRQGNVGSEVFE